MTTIFDREYHGVVGIGEMQDHIRNMWNVRVNPLAKEMPEELTGKEFKGTIRVVITYSREEEKEPEDIKIGDQVKEVIHNSPLLTVMGIGINYYLCEWHVNDKKHTGWFHKDSIMVH